MALNILKIATKAKNIPEVGIVIRVVLALVGGFVLLPVASALVRRPELSASDYLGLVVFGAVGLWLLRTAWRGSE